MKISSAIALALIISAARPLLARADLSQDCAIEDTTTISRTAVKRIPGYFIRQIPGQNAVGYASASDTDPTQGQNYYLNLDTGSEVELPGPYDPVPTPDGSLLTIPSWDVGLTFYDLQSTVRGVRNALATDAKMIGSYQSAGTLSPGYTLARYRAIVVNRDTGVTQFRDYTAIRGVSGQLQVIPEGDAPKPLCPNVDYNRSLPMISKSGREVSLLNTKTNTTQIYSIDGNTGRCTLVEDLGLFTGKVDFSYRGDLLTFHVSNNDQTGNVSWFQTPSDEMVEDVYVYDRNKREIRRLTHNAAGSNAVYPNFRKDGKVVYLQYSKDGSGRTHAEFVVADPKLSRPISLDDFSARCQSAAKERQFNAVVALGGLWAALCAKTSHSPSATTAALNALSLDPAKCRALVGKYWSALRSRVVSDRDLISTGHGKVKAELLSALTTSDLLAACPGSTLPAAQPKVVGAAAPQSGPNPAIPTQCLGCHPRFPWQDPNALRALTTSDGKSAIEEMISRIDLPPDNPKHMPMGGGMLGADAKKRFVDFLDGVRKAPGSAPAGPSAPETPTPGGNDDALDGGAPPGGAPQ